MQEWQAGIHYQAVASTKYKNQTSSHYKGYLTHRWSGRRPGPATSYDGRREIVFRVRRPQRHFGPTLVPPLSVGVQRKAFF